MRTRSRRFFLVMLHLVGCRHRFWIDPGITGVQPWPIVLEPILSWQQELADQLEESAQRRKRRRRKRQEGASTNKFEPVWLQDDQSGLCLGPTTTFSECGDATLWFVRAVPVVQQQQPRRRRALLGIFDVDEEEMLPQNVNMAPKQQANETVGLMFQVVDRDWPIERGAMPNQLEDKVVERWWRNIFRRRRKRDSTLSSSAECLVSTADHKIDVVPCSLLDDGSARPRHWPAARGSRSTSHPSELWTLDARGALQAMRQPHDQHDEHEQQCDVCVHKRGSGMTSSSHATLGSCRPPPRRRSGKSLLVSMTLVRYRAVPMASISDLQQWHSRDTAERARRQQQQQRQSGDAKLIDAPDHDDQDQMDGFNSNNLPTNRDPSFSMPPTATAHRPTSQTRHRHSTSSTTTSRPSSSLATLAAASSQQPPQPAHFKALLDRTNPILLAPTRAQRKARAAAVRHQMSPFSVLKDTNPILWSATASTSTSHLQKQRRSSKSSSPTMLDDIDVGAVLKLRSKIQTHPYLEKASNELWACPQTGLTYPTDLRRYLGLDPDHGRHTLMGMGLYKKFVIKIYGIAYYVSKRDALANNAVFADYATLSAHELRQRPDFYERLRLQEGAGFDRTLLVKTNMQLAAQQIRDSLHADWSMLSTEAKDTLIGSSMQPRPATDAMLALIASPDNPSRCSCSQVAPDSYQADMTCCARGTELAFTWRKNGDLQVRLNGALMETFARPDIAQGIFFEYLRTDDPISPDFRDNVVLGFPFLLAPLAQMRDLELGHGKEARWNNDGAGGSNALYRAMVGASEAASALAAGIAGTAAGGAQQATIHAAGAAKMIGAVAIEVGKEAERRREQLVRQALALPVTLSKAQEAIMHAPDNVAKIKDTVAKLPDLVWRTFAGDQNDESAEAEYNTNANATPFATNAPKRRLSQGRLFGYPLSRWFSDAYYAPDEIGPMKVLPVPSTTRKIFLALVHLYLLLMFIVSFPGSYTVRTKLTTTTTARASKRRCDDDERGEPPQGSARRRSRRHGDHNGAHHVIQSALKKKSFSYFL